VIYVAVMDRDKLRRIQAPIKQQYRDVPESATITLEASGELGTETVSCSVQTGQALVRAGLHPGTGGDGAHVCSGDMLLQALVACAGVTLRSVATSRGLDLRGGTVRAEGDLDFRGTLGIDQEVPVGFDEIRLRFDLDTSASAEDVSSLIATTEKYCVVLQTLASSPNLMVDVSVA
jgi:uncharacterized OsmC-like protein